MSNFLRSRLQIRTSNRRSSISLLGLMLSCAFGLYGSLGFAQSANISGNWNSITNNSSGLLQIAQNSSNVITGTMLGDTIEGRYIPDTRRLIFVRLLPDGTPFQLYEAYVSQNGEFLAGSLMVWNGAGGASNGGLDFNFSAERETGPPEPESYRLTVKHDISNGSGTVTSSPGGINCGRDCTEVYAANTVVTLTATPNSGSFTSLWRGDCQVGINPNTTVLRMDGNKTCRVMFESKELKLNEPR